MFNINLIYMADKKVKLDSYQKNLLSEFLSMDLEDSILIAIDTIKKESNLTENKHLLLEAFDNIESFSKSTLLKSKAFLKTHLNEIVSFIKYLNPQEKGVLKVSFCLRDEEESYITIHSKNEGEEKILYTKNVSKEFSLEKNKQAFILGFSFIATVFKIHEEGSI